MYFKFIKLKQKSLMQINQDKKIKMKIRFIL